MQTLSAAGIQRHDYVGIHLKAKEMIIYWKSFEINTVIDNSINVYVKNKN